MAETLVKVTAGNGHPSKYSCLRGDPGVGVERVRCGAAGGGGQTSCWVLKQPAPVGGVVGFGVPIGVQNRRVVGLEGCR
jgi:hypothetical protein